MQIVHPRRFGNGSNSATPTTDFWPWPRPYDQLPHDDAGPRGIATTVILTTIAFSLTVARAYCRAGILRFFGAEDWAIVISMLACIGCTISFCINVTKNEIGHHTWDISHNVDMVDVVRITQVSVITFLLSIAFSKASLLLQLIRITPAPSTYRWFLWGVFCFNVLFNLTAVLMAALYCLPPSYVWERVNPMAILPPEEEKCLNPRVLHLTLAGVNLVTDVIIWVAPVPLIMRLRASKFQKASLFVVFGIGVICVVADAIRLKYLNDESKTWVVKKGEVQPLSDSSYTIHHVYLWMIIEISVAIICCSIAVTRPLFNRVLHAFGLRLPHSYTPEQKNRAIPRVYRGTDLVNMDSYRSDTGGGEYESVASRTETYGSSTAGGSHSNHGPATSDRKSLDDSNL